MSGITTGLFDWADMQDFEGTGWELLLNLGCDLRVKIGWQGSTLYMVSPSSLEQLVALSCE